jgi:signal transduction histidine kinase/ligand-binding sensor domain-containing protein
VSPRRHLVLSLLVVSGLVVCGHAQVHAQNPVAPAHQRGNFHQTSWGSEDGIGAVFDIQQSRDGYLWLTTSRGVLRFDGVKFDTLQDVTNGAIRNGDVNSVMVGRGDYVWLTTRAAGLLLWKEQKVTAYPFDRRCISAAFTNGMAEDADGSLWVRGLSGLYHVNGASCERIDADRGYPGGFPAAIFVDRHETVWVKAPSGALMSRARGESSFRLRRYVSGPSPNPAFLREDPEGTLWISDEQGVRPVDLRTLAPQSPPSVQIRAPASSSFGDFAFGHDGSLWVVTPNGVSRVERQHWQRGGVVAETPRDQFARGDGLSSDVVWRLSIGREGEVWAASNSGLDQLRRTTLTSVALPLAGESQLAIAAGDRASVWVGSANLPLTHVQADGTVRSFPDIGHVSCIRRDRHGRVWVGGDRLFRVQETPGRPPTIVDMHYPEEHVARIVAIAVDRNDDVLITLRPGPTYRLVNGTWRNEGEALGKWPGIIGDMMADDEGNIWFAFAWYLVRWDGHAYQRYSYPPGPLDISVVTMAIAHDHVWLAGQGGILMFADGRFHPMTYEDPSVPGRISGIVETSSGDLWMNGFSGINHVPADAVTRYLRNPESLVRAEHFDAQDGLPGLSAERFPVPSMIATQDGRLWVATTKGIAWLDPTAIGQRHNPIPPPVYVKSIVANGVSYAAVSGLALPTRTDSLEIDYTALSLTMPQRVLFRYRLDGVDNDWQPPVSRRQAFYANLGPGRYTFRVIAANNDGIWNDTGAAVDVVIPPTFAQSALFKGLCVAALAALLVLAYRLRMTQVTAHIRARMSERAAERERIARDLHDTFFQSIQGLLLRFNTATSRLQADHPARGMLEEVLKQSDDVMAEGRNLLVHLHGTTSKPDDLPTALADYGEEMQEGRSSAFKVVANGSIRPLHPIILEELTRIGREGLGNAFRHAKARSIEAELNYGSGELRMRLRDDGVGIDPDILKEGRRDGHLGLASMRARAAGIGAQLDIWSRAGLGTEIELRIPANLAYVSTPTRGSRRFWRRRDAS